MDLVKKNIVSIVCGVVALVCVILVFWPLGGMFADMSKKVNDSKTTGEGLAKLRNEKRYWPTLSVKEEDRVPLTRFPTDAITNTGKTVTDSWTAEKEKFVAAAIDVQKKSLVELVPGLLPGGGPQYLQQQFMEKYAALMNLKSAAAAAGGGMGTPMGGMGLGAAAAGQQLPQEGPPKPVLGTPLVGRMPPSEPEIKARGDIEEANIRRDRIRVINGAIVNQLEVDQLVANTRAEIGDQIRTEVAKGSMVYVDPLLSFVASDKIVGTTPPSYDDIFLAQTGLWLQQELCRAVYDVNKPVFANSQQGVVDAPIKRLVGIRFQLPYQLPPAPVPGTPAPTDVPVLPAMPAAKVAVDFTKNPLGQTSNDLYDVLPFRLSLIVEADTLSKTLAGLTHNRYIAIRGVDVVAVDAALAYTQGFIYGQKPVVQVELRGQYLMMRGFIGKFMPPNIIRGILTPAVPAGGPVPGAEM